MKGIAIVFAVAVIIVAFITLTAPRQTSSVDAQEQRCDLSDNYNSGISYFSGKLPGAYLKLADRFGLSSKVVDNHTLSYKTSEYMRQFICSMDGWNWPDEEVHSNNGVEYSEAWIFLSHLVAKLQEEHVIPSNLGPAEQGEFVELLKIELKDARLKYIDK